MSHVGTHDFRVVSKGTNVLKELKFMGNLKFTSSNHGYILVIECWVFLIEGFNTGRYRVKTDLRSNLPLLSHTNRYLKKQIYSAKQQFYAICSHIYLLAVNMRGHLEYLEN